jgi:hypothetical protein
MILYPNLRGPVSFLIYFIGSYNLVLFIKLPALQRRSQPIPEYVLLLPQRSATLRWQSTAAGQVGLPRRCGAVVELRAEFSRTFDDTVRVCDT